MRGISDHVRIRMPFRFLIGFAAIACLMAAAFFMRVGAVSGSLQDQVAIQHVSMRAETLLVDGGSRDTYYPKGWQGGAVAPSVASAARRHLDTDLSAVFAPGLAAKYSAQLAGVFSRSEMGNANNPEPSQLTAAQLANANDTYPIVRLRGRVNSMTYDSLSVRSDAAKLSATVDVSVDVAQIQAGHEYLATPHNIILVQETLQRVSGSWLIADRSQDFAPGGGP